MTRWAMTMGILAAFSAGAAEAVEGARANAVVVQLSGGTAVLGSLGGLGGLGSLVSPGAVGLEFEHRLGRLGLSLGVSGSAYAQVATPSLSTSSVMVTVEPGLRWYLAAGSSGLWFGASIPASYQSFGATGFWGDTETIGVAPSVGFSHRFDSGLVVQLSAGPVAQITLTQMRSGSPGIGFVGGNNVVGAVRLRAGIGAGWAF